MQVLLDPNSARMRCFAERVRLAMPLLMLPLLGLVVVWLQPRVWAQEGGDAFFEDPAGGVPAAGARADAQVGVGSQQGATAGSARRGFGSDARMATMQPALRGYCPVCLVEMKEWVRGDPRHGAVYDDKLYVFPGEQQLQMFRAAPEKYVPSLGGDCVVHFAMTGQRVPGDLSLGARHDGRIYFFAGPQHKQAFMANPTKFAAVDLALGGNCVVCRKEMNQAVPGLPEVTVVYHGLRYQFAGAQQMRQFMSAPDGYASLAAAAAPGSPAQPASSAGSGSSGSGRAAPRPGPPPQRGSGSKGSGTVVPNSGFGT